MAGATPKKKCAICNQLKTEGYFIKSFAPPLEYFPYCNPCITKRYKDCLKQTEGNVKAAIWLMCGFTNTPYIDDVGSEVLESPTEKVNPFISYCSLLRKKGRSWSGFIDSDTMLDNKKTILNYQETIEDIEEELTEEEIEALEATDEQAKKNQEKWGSFEKSDYKLLNKLFKNYTEDLFNMSTVQELRYRDLCKAELAKRKADEEGDIALAGKAQENLFKLMTLLKLNEFQSKVQSDTDKHIERMCWMIENTRPAECEDLEKYKDISGFGEAFKDLARTIKNLVAGSKEYPDIPKEEL